MATFFLSILVFLLSVWQIEAYITVTLGGGEHSSDSKKGLLYIFLLYDVPGAPTTRPDFQAASDQPNKADELVACSLGLSI